MDKERKKITENRATNYNGGSIIFCGKKQYMGHVLTRGKDTLLASSSPLFLRQ